MNLQSCLYHSEYCSFVEYVCVYMNVYVLVNTGVCTYLCVCFAGHNIKWYNLFSDISIVMINNNAGNLW